MVSALLEMIQRSLDSVDQSAIATSRREEIQERLDGLKHSVKQMERKWLLIQHSTLKRREIDQ